MNLAGKTGQKLNFQMLWEKYSALVLAVVMAIVFSRQSGSFLSAENLKKIIYDNIPLAMSVLGVSEVMIGGGIDFSIGYQISLLSVLISSMSNRHLPAPLLVLGILTASGICGLMNGVMVAYVGVAPFAATIATQIIFRGLSYYLSNGSMSSNISAIVRNMTRTGIFSVRWDLWMAALTIFLFVLVMKFLYVGRSLRAVGLDEESAMRSGIKVNSVKLFSYIMASFFYAMAAMVMTSKRGYAGSTIGEGMEITSIATAYVGGILWQAENPNIINLLLGVFVVGMIDNGLQLTGVNPFLQYIFTGFILLIAMSTHRRRKNGAAR